MKKVYNILSRKIKLNIRPIPKGPATTYTAYQDKKNQSVFLKLCLYTDIIIKNEIIIIGSVTITL